MSYETFLGDWFGCDPKEIDMADHGDNYKRMKADDGTEIGALGAECGHHCGVITTGHKDQRSGHCKCTECHDDLKIVGEVPTQFTMSRGGVDPRGIH